MGLRSSSEFRCRSDRDPRPGKGRLSHLPDQDCRERPWRADPRHKHERSAYQPATDPSRRKGTSVAAYSTVVTIASLVIGWRHGVGAIERRPRGKREPAGCWRRRWSLHGRVRAWTERHRVL